MLKVDLSNYSRYNFAMSLENSPKCIGRNYQYIKIVWR